MSNVAVSTSKSRLAREGGAPVRDVKQHPWPKWPMVSETQWVDKLEPALKAVYLSQVEGVGGTRAVAFAESFAKFCQAKHCRLLPHGTDAIEAALVAALELENWGPSGEAIIPNYTFMATAGAALQQRMSLALVDIDPESFTISPEAIEQAIRPGKTRAIVPVHIAGHPADMDAINAIARKHDLKVIEDCAQAHGAQYRGKPVGALGDAGAFSFQSSKNLCSGEGGAVVTNDAQIDGYVHAVMNAGRAPGGARWEYPRVGFNYRPSEYVAAILGVRLEALEAETAHREKMATVLSKHLAQVKGVKPPIHKPWCTRHANHLYAMTVNPDDFGGRTRDEIVAALNAEGIPCSAGYTQPLSAARGLRNLAEQFPDAIRVLPCPVTDDVCARSIWLLQEMLLADEKSMLQVVEAMDKVQRVFAAR